MSEKVLLGRDKQILEIPESVWKGHFANLPEHSRERLGFMTGDHHRVRYFVVRELVKLGKPIEPGNISAALDLPLEKVNAILAELEGNLVFLVRNESGAVAWAYPVTVEPTPHRLNFSTGERLYGA